LLSLAVLVALKTLRNVVLVAAALAVCERVRFPSQAALDIQLRLVAVELAVLVAAITVLTVLTPYFLQSLQLVVVVAVQIKIMV
jgi:hypothetical protein